MSFIKRIKIFLLFAAAIVLQQASYAQTAPVVFSESDLPIVVINTNSQTIKDDPKIIVNMGIIYNGPGVRNHLSDPQNEYNGKIAIEFRGSSSQSFPKKSYGFETRNSTGNIKIDVGLFGMSPEHDWILSANYTDKTFCRNVVAYQLSREMGHYAVNTKYVDLVLNGAHQGIYVFMESIKRDSGRVDIKNLHPNEITQPDVSGGYILKVDKRTGSGGSGWTSPYAPINHGNGQTTYLQYDFPSADSIVPSQEAYIQSYVDSFEDALAGSNFRDSIVGYPKYIGNGSWMDYFFCNELTKNVDGYRISSYLYKDKNKSLKAGPVWDYDIAWGNANYCSGSDTTGWAYLFPCTGDGYQVPFWWQRLLQDTNYTNEMKCRWTNFRQNVMSEQHIFSIIDSVASYLDESKTWNFQKWPILGTYVWPNPSPQPSTYAGEIQNLKNWVHRRLLWIDANIPGRCSCGLTASVVNASCNNSCDGRLIALGSSSYKKTYLWSNGISSDTLENLCNGSYSVTLTDKIGCTKSYTATVTEPSALSVSVTKTNTNCSGNGCNGSASVTTSGGSSPYNYTWSGGQHSNSISSLCQGNYSVVVTDAHGCTKSSNANIQNPSAPNVTLASATPVSCYGDNDGAASVTVVGGTGPFTYSWSPAGGSRPSRSGLTAGIQTVTVTDATGCTSQISISINQPSAFAFNTNIISPLCNGLTGTASVNITGGSSPYSYSWSPGGATTPLLNNVQPGNYSLTVTDNHGCTSTSNILIPEPAPFTFTYSTQPPACNGDNTGSADVDVTGGTGALSYSWSPSGNTGQSAHNLSAGNYSVTVTDANNCSETYALTITDPLPLTLTSSHTVATCGMHDGSITVSPHNGVRPYTYSWSSSSSTDSTATSLNAGNHIVFVHDANGCLLTDTITVGSSSGLAVSISGHPQVSCAGMHDASATLNVSGGSSPYSYSWSPGGGSNASHSNLAAGNYSVTITESNGCMTAYQLTISDPPPMIVNVQSTPASCAGDSSGTLLADVTGGIPPYSYHWTSSNSTTQLAGHLTAGSYNVIVTDDNGCSHTASSTVTEPGLIFITTNHVDASCEDANGIAGAVAVGGTGPFTYYWSTGDSGEALHNLPAGNYTITATDSIGCQVIKTIVIGGTTKPRLHLSSTHDITCNGGNDGAIVVTTTGVAGPYTYAWTPSVSTGLTANNLTSGVYSIVVTDQQHCNDSIGLIISEPAQLAAQIYSENTLCFGSSDGLLYADVGGGTPPYFYQWVNGQTTDTAFNLAIGSYSLVITDANNCSTSASGTVSEPDPMIIHFAVTNATCPTCSDGTIQASVFGGVTPYAYNWTPSHQNTPAIYNLYGGVYTLCVTDANNCVQCDSAKVNPGVIGIEEIHRSSSLYVYPNPVSQTAVFAFTLGNKQFVDLKIFSPSGQLVETLQHDYLNAGEQLIRFDATDLTPGIYFYQFTIDSRFQAGAIVVSR